MRKCSVCGGDGRINREKCVVKDYVKCNIECDGCGFETPACDTIRSAEGLWNALHDWNEFVTETAQKFPIED